MKMAKPGFIQVDKLSEFLFSVKEPDLLQLKFSEKLWNTTVERVTVYEDGRLVWRFRNGCEMEAGV